MIYLLGNLEPAIIAFVGILFAFAATCIAIAKLNKYLPKDMGRQFAHDGALSAGKPRGAGIIFVLTFVAAALLFAQMNVEIGIYLILIVVEMFTGYFDDAAEKPWGEYLKGFLDLARTAARSTPSPVQPSQSRRFYSQFLRLSLCGHRLMLQTVRTA